MKKLIFVTLFIAFTLSACGVKGPLYFPEESEQTQQSF